MPASRLAPGDLVRIRDERWVVTRNTSGSDAAILDVRGSGRSNLGDRASFILPFELVEPLPASTAPRRVRPQRWRRIVRPMLASATPTWDALRSPLRARISLLAFQLEPALAVTHGLASRLLIADEVGLGKTIQAALVVAEILERTPHGRALIVAPAALRDQWREELGNRFQLDAWIADSTSLARLGPTLTSAGNAWSAHAVTLTSIDFVKRPEVMRSLEGLVWDAIVFDEAHALSGRSDRAIAANALARRARTVIMLTATPHSGDDRAFQDLCAIGDIERQFPLLTFRRTRTDVGLTIRRRTTTLRVRLSPAEREMHRALTTYVDKVRIQRGAEGGAHLAMAVLSRRACSSAASLARSVERRLALLDDSEPQVMKQLSLPIGDPMDDEEPGAELGVPGLDDGSEERRLLRRILQLAVQASSTESKLRVLSRLLRRIDEPAIVFTEYRDTLTRLAEEWRASAPALLHGGLTGPERRDVIHRFTTGAVRLLLATDAASEGLNLHQRCRLVINLELPWTPLRLEQRVGRVERIGQQRSVHAVHLLAVGTAEEALLRRLDVRVERASAALTSLGSSPDVPQSDVGTNVRAVAAAEARRIERARAVMAGSTTVAGDGRPTVTSIRARGERATIWGYRLIFTDTEGRLVWDTLFGAAVPLDTVTPHEAWRHLAVATERLTVAMEAPIQQWSVLLAASLAAPLALLARREQAIAACISGERARLAAQLLQPGLFERRDGGGGEQDAVLDQAMVRSQARLDELARLRLPVVERRCLAFALLRR